jgi:hypothetical protein
VNLSSKLFAVASFFVATNAWAVDQQRSFGSMTGSACTGNVVPETSGGVQIFGFTNAARRITWEVYSVDEFGTVALELRQSGRSIDETVSPVDGLEYFACAVKTGTTGQDFDVSINSQAIE